MFLGKVTSSHFPGTKGDINIITSWHLDREMSDILKVPANQIYWFFILLLCLTHGWAAIEACEMKYMPFLTMPFLTNSNTGSPDHYPYY